MYKKERLEKEANEIIKFAEKIHSRESLKNCNLLIEQIKAQFYDKFDSKKYTFKQDERCNFCKKCDEKCPWKFYCKICYQNFPLCFLKVKKMILASDSVLLCHVPRNCITCWDFESRKKITGKTEFCFICQKEGVHCAMHCTWRFSEKDILPSSDKFRHRNPIPNKCYLCSSSIGHNQVNCLLKPRHTLLNRIKRKRKNSKEPEVRVIGFVSRNNGEYVDFET